MRGVRAIVPIAGPKPTEDLVRNLAAGVAVVADNTWAAMQARKALKIDWEPGAVGDGLHRGARTALRARRSPARRHPDRAAATAT